MYVCVKDYKSNAKLCGVYGNLLQIPNYFNLSRILDIMVGLAACRESAGTESRVQTLQAAQVLTAEWCPEL